MFLFEQPKIRCVQHSSVYCADCVYRMRTFESALMSRAKATLIWRYVCSNFVSKLDSRFCRVSCESVPYAPQASVLLTYLRYPRRTTSLDGLENAESLLCLREVISFTFLRLVRVLYNIHVNDVINGERSALCDHIGFCSYSMLFNVRGL